MQRRISLCRRGCCPEVRLDCDSTSRWPVEIVEPGGPDRPAATLRLTREEATELARVLAAEGFAESSPKPATA